MCNSVDLTHLGAAHPGGGGSAMPLPRAGTGGMVQYLDPSEPASRARLEVSARSQAQEWAWCNAFG